MGEGQIPPFSVCIGHCYVHDAGPAGKEFQCLLFHVYATPAYIILKNGIDFAYCTLLGHKNKDKRPNKKTL